MTTMKLAGASGEVERQMMPFVRTLFSMANGEYEGTLVEWTAKGTRIAIREPARFAAEVCPKFFSHSNWTSFTRMMNMYEFVKINDAAGPGVAFEHAYFTQAGEADLWRIKRKKQNRTRSPKRAASEIDGGKAAESAASPAAAVGGEKAPKVSAGTDAAAWKHRAAELEASVAALTGENARLKRDLASRRVLDNQAQSFLERDASFQGLLLREDSDLAGALPKRPSLEAVDSAQWSAEFFAKRPSLEAVDSAQWSAQFLAGPPRRPSASDDVRYADGDPQRDCYSNYTNVFETYLASYVPASCADCFGPTATTRDPADDGFHVPQPRRRGSA